MTKKKEEKEEKSAVINEIPAVDVRLTLTINTFKPDWSVFIIIIND